MPLANLDIVPGIYNEDSDLGGKGRWVDGDKVRFFKGKPEKIGGWQTLNSSAATGIVRGMLPWVTFDNKKYIAVGTHLKMYVYGTAFNDQTPIRKTVDPMGADPFATTSGSSTVTVTDTAHGAISNDFVTFSGATAVNGLTIDGNYQLTKVNDNSYTIDAGSNASGTGSGGGSSVKAEYEINTGGVDGVFGLGYGTGTWSASTWGTARTTSNIFIAPRSWSFSSWGEDLIANPRGGGIYVWDASTGPGHTNRATLIANAPANANFILVTPESRFLIAFGAHDGSAENRLNIRWSDREDYNTWTAAATNQAGSKLLDTGTEILAATHILNETIVWTDQSAYLMNFIGGNEVFSFQHMGDHIGLRAPHAWVEYEDRVYWMGEDDFFVYDGRIRAMRCDVKQHIFNNITSNQRQKCHAILNSQFNEIWWFYPRTSNTEISHYVSYNYEEDVWAIGELARTSGIDKGEVQSSPTWAGPTGSNSLLYSHDTGVDDNGSAMSVYIESGDVDIAGGNLFFFTDRVVPDFPTLDGTVQLTFKYRRYPKATEQSKGPFSITSSTEKVDFRARGRQGAVRIASSAVGDNWRMGTLRVNFVPDGGR